MIATKPNGVLTAMPYILTSAVIFYFIGSGLYYEGANDTVFQTYVYGLFNGGGNAMPDTFGCFALISSPLNFLQKHLPFFNWYDGLQLVLLLIGFLTLLNFFQFFQPDKNTYSLLIILLFCGTMAGSFFKPVECMKTAIFLSGISLIGIYRSKSVAGFVFFGALFLTALLIRVESGVLTFAFAFVFNVLRIGRADFKDWLKKTLIPLFLIGAVSVFVNFPKTPEEEYYLKIRPYEYAVTDFDRNDAIASLQNREDSVILSSCVNFFFADSSHCNKDFFQKIGLLQFDKTPKALLLRFLDLNIEKRKLVAYGDILEGLKWMLLILLVLLFWILTNRWIGIRILFANFLCFLLLSFISLWLKPEEHVICPALVFLILLNANWIQEHNFSGSFSSRKSLLAAFALTIFLGGEILRQYERVSAEKEKADYYLSVAKYTAAYPGQNFILNIGVWDEAHRKMFQQNLFSSLPHTYVLDGAILYLNRDYQHLMLKVTGSTSFIGQWEYFIGKPGSTFVSSRKRMDIILEYLNTVYHKNYRAFSIKQFDSTSMGDQAIGLYKVQGGNAIE